MASAALMPAPFPLREVLFDGMIEVPATLRGVAASEPIRRDGLCRWSESTVQQPGGFFVPLIGIVRQWPAVRASKAGIHGGTGVRCS